MARLAYWRRWLEHPQRAPGRAILFQIHLWLGVAMAAYVLVISVSGSAVVFRREASAWLVPRSVPSTRGERLTGDALRAAIAAAYPGYEITEVSEPTRAERPVQVTRSRGGRRSDRLFDPYAGVDMGDVFPPTLRALEWLVELHDNLLVEGRLGRQINALASALVGLMIVTGAVLWWPGRARWRKRLVLPRPSRTRRFLWHLHSVVGFWSFALLAVWVVTGLYFGFPRLFDWLAVGAETDAGYVTPRSEQVLLAMIDLHFGRFGGLEVRITWTLLGLLPAVLAVTGTIVWWRRVIGPRLAARRDAPAASR